MKNNAMKKQGREQELTYRDGLVKALLWVYNGPESKGIDFTDVNDVWNEMGTGLAHLKDNQRITHIERNGVREHWPSKEDQDEWIANHLRLGRL